MLNPILKTDCQNHILNKILSRSPYESTIPKALPFDCHWISLSWVYCTAYILSAVWMVLAVSLLLFKRNEELDATSVA